MPEDTDQFHYAPGLINLIRKYPSQEIGTHTFSHYFCLEPGQDLKAFVSDLEAAFKAAEKYNLRFKSLVFPKNQINNEYLPFCRNMGITSYRGLPDSKIHWPVNMSGRKPPLYIRGLRLMDSYFKVTGNNSYSIGKIPAELPIAIPYSRFLRPYRKEFKVFEPLRVKRIKKEMEYAAKTGRLYHLWWHPYNFGNYLDENLRLLKQIAEHYAKLKAEYGMRSMNMSEFAEELNRGELI
jgi:hypothetical protein